MTDSISVKI